MHKTQTLWRLNALALICLVLCIASGVIVSALPDTATITPISNTTKTAGLGGLINTSGGSITTITLNATTQNQRWKAYVGNVTGTLALADADDFTIYDWDLTDVVGEIYATRSSSSISWSDVNCSTFTNISNEEDAINHTSNPNDNISRTFSQKSHEEFYVGSNKIAANSCFSLHTYVNDTAQSADFAEILLHDGSNMIYSTILEEDRPSYHTNYTFDFQMIVPENGQPGWSSSTAYYFYVELI